MNKLELCDFFAEQLEYLDIKYSRYNNGFHFQIDTIHNFYPTKRTYYNSETGAKSHFRDFRTKDDFYSFIESFNKVDPTTTKDMFSTDDLFTLDKIILMLKSKDASRSSIESAKALRVKIYNILNS